VSTHEQNPDHQIDALRRAGVSEENLFIDKVSGKLASRPKLDAMLGKLRAGDEVVVTRLRRIGRSQQHLLDLVRGFGEEGVDFIVLEQGIDTFTTLDGLAAARARGRVGGWPAALSQRQLDQAQRMYDAGEHTVEEIAEMFRVGRATLYWHLSSHRDGGDLALVVYRNTRTRKVDADTNRRYGETGASEAVQREADRKWFNIAPVLRDRLKAIVYVADGVVSGVRAVDPNGTWAEDDRGYADVPVTAPLTELQIAELRPGRTAGG
jgi:DNA invertase Pin-like site-specific DNA recombinase